MIRGGVRFLTVALGLTVALANQAQENESLTCNSTGRGRTFCTADTSGGVRLTGSHGRVPCVQGTNWDFDTRGVWVDHDCDGEFALFAGRQSANLPQQSQSGPARLASGAHLGIGTTISVRTNERIDTRRLDGRIFSGVVESEVMDGEGNLAIPRGSDAELLVRNASSQQLTLDLASIVVRGERYSVSADSETVNGGQRDSIGGNKRTAKFVGGGAILGTIIGAIAGGGKGAAIGAAAGAGAGAGTQLLTRGSVIRVPAESVLTFQLDQPLQIGIEDRGYERRGHHYHR